MRKPTLSKTVLEGLRIAVEAANEWDFTGSMEDREMANQLNKASQWVSEMQEYKRLLKATEVTR